MKRLLRENPDQIDAFDILTNRDINIAWDADDTACAFGYFKGKLLVTPKAAGYGDRTHTDLQDMNTINFVPDPMDNIGSRRSFKFPGRVWPRAKIISFWIYPNPSMLPRVISDLNKVSGGQFHITDDWRIEVNPDISKEKHSTKTGNIPAMLSGDWANISRYTPNSKLIRIDQYIGSKDAKGQEITHAKSPLLRKKKNVPSGLGSKKLYPGQKPGETTAQWKAKHQQESKITESTSQASGYNAEAGEPTSGHLPGGFTRTINHPKGKPEAWFKQGGYTQMDFPVADFIYGKTNAGNDTWMIRKSVQPQNVSTATTQKKLEKDPAINITFDKPDFEATHTVVALAALNANDTATIPITAKKKSKKIKERRNTLRYAFNIKG